MPSRSFSLYNPFLALGPPVATLRLIDDDDRSFEAPLDASGNNQSAELDGVPVTINALEQAVGPQLVVAMVGGVQVSLSLTPIRVTIESGFIDDTYILFPNLPLGASIVSVSLPLVFPNDVAVPLCFCGETLIETANGAERATDIAPGDLVQTVDRGLQPVRWVGRRHIDFTRSPELERHKPIRFERGALDGEAPYRPLRLSPMHKLLMGDWRTQLHFGQDEALVPAKSLINGTSIRQDTEAHEVEYVHLLFERHEVVVAEGALAESLFLGDLAMNGPRFGVRDELLSIFPDIEDVAASMTSSRAKLRYREGRVLAEA